MSEEKKIARKPKSFELNATMKKKATRTTYFKDHNRKLRKSIVPGAVLILLTGAHKGRHVVFLKALQSGLLLVSGPFKVNGVPLRRVHPARVIATKTVIAVAETLRSLPGNIDDAYFKRQSERKAPSKTEDLFVETTARYAPREQRKADQRTVDAALMADITTGAESGALLGYLRSRFSLSHGDKPHQMAF